MRNKDLRIKIFTSLVIATASLPYLDYYPLMTLVLYAHAWNDTARVLIIFANLTLLRTFIGIAIVNAFNKRIRWVDVSVIVLLFGLPLYLTAQLLGHPLDGALAEYYVSFYPSVTFLFSLLTDFPRLLMLLFLFPAVERYIRSRRLVRSDSP
jgi:hypothetical protein